MNTELLNDYLVKTNLLNEIIYFEELASTNIYAKQNFSKLKDKSLILTSNQTKGIGRFGREWKSSKDQNLSFTIIKSCNLRIDEIHFMNFYSSLILFFTIKHFIAGFSDHEFYLKWPNDILLNHKKISGLLLEINDLSKESKKFIIGIGVNVNQTNFHEDIISKATSLKKEFRTDFIPELILIKYIELFFENISLFENKTKIMEKWISFTNIIGRYVKFKQLEDDEEITAKVTGIDNDGGLIVSLENEKNIKFYSGEISIIY